MKVKNWTPLSLGITLIWGVCSRKLLFYASGRYKFVQVLNVEATGGENKAKFSATCSVPEGCRVCCVFPLWCSFSPKKKKKVFKNEDTCHSQPLWDIFAWGVLLLFFGSILKESSLGFGSVNLYSSSAWLSFSRAGRKSTTFVSAPFDSGCRLCN